MIDNLDRLYIATSLLIQLVLLGYFALRAVNLNAAIRWGWIVYALALPAVAASLVLLIAGKPWYLWIAGLLFAVWAGFGYVVDIAHPVVWRNPIIWPVFLPYVLLYLASLMFYWWPLATLDRSLWFVYAALFITSTALNLSSHAAA